MTAPNLKRGEPMVTITVKIYQDNALSVESTALADREWMVAALLNAADAVKNQSRPKGSLIVPGRDVSL